MSWIKLHKPDFFFLQDFDFDKNGDKWKDKSDPLKKK